MTAIFLFLFSVVFLAVSGAATPGKVAKESLLGAYGKLPLYFIENKGQLDPKVRFYVKTSGQTLYFIDEGIVFDLLRKEKDAGKSTEGAENGHQITGVKTGRLVFNLRFENAEQGVSVEGLGRQDAGINYFVGNDKSKWKTGIPACNGVVYKGVYKGIDLRVYGNGKDIEYEFIVNPGGDPNDILLTYDGIEGLATNGEGELLISTAFGELKESRPYLYQEIQGKKMVDGNFEIRISVGQSQTGKFSYNFRVDSYDPSYPLIIDPTLSYATYLGGSMTDYGGALAVDDSGNVYVTGSTYSRDFPTVNPYQGLFEGMADVFVTKLSSSGNALIYSTYLGGNLNDHGYGIAVDGEGNAYVVGSTGSINFPMKNAYQGANAGGFFDVFVTKLSSSGNALSYSTYLGGSMTESGAGIAVGGTGNAYVTGYTESSDFPTKLAYQGPNTSGFQDVFITKLSASGSTLSYSTYLGGSKGDSGRGIAIDGEGNAYVTGTTGSSDFPTKNPYQGNLSGASDAFITKLSTAQSGFVFLTYLAYSTYLGGGSYDNGTGVAVDGSGNAYVTGYTESSDFPTKNPYQGSNAGISDIFITKLSSSGNALSYSTYLGGNSFDEDTGGIAIDGSGNAYVTGVTYSTNFPTKNPVQANLSGPYDAFITKLSSSGNALSYSTYLGGNMDDNGIGVAVDGEGNAYVVGATGSSDFPTKYPYQATHAGGPLDAFVAKLSDVAYVSSNGSCGNKTPCYSTIQAAINAASTVATIRIAQGTYTQSITLSTSKLLLLKGGWNSSFTTQTSNTTFIKAPKAPKGSLTLQMVTIKP